MTESQFFATKTKLFVVLLCLTFVILVALGCENSQNSQKEERLQKKITESVLRGNSQRMGAAEEAMIDLPLSEKWKYFSHEKGIESDPAVADGFVFYGSFDSNLYALDPENGQVKWKYETQAPIFGSPAVIGGKVFFGSMDGVFYALDTQNGAKKWSFDTNAFPPVPADKTERGIYSSPAFAEGVVYFGTWSKRFYALNAATGEKLWEFIANDKVDMYSSAVPSVSAGVVYFSILDKLYAVDAKTGVKKWETGGHNSPIGTPTISSGVVLVEDSLNIWAYDADSGSPLWNIDFNSTCGSACGSSIKDGVVFFGDEEGFHSVDLKTGKTKWENKTLEVGSSGIPPVFAGDYVYFIDLEASIEVIDIESGEIKGQYKFQDGFDTSWGLPTSMTVANGVIYFGSMDGNIYAIEGASS